jgi:hypothetical protein
MTEYKRSKRDAKKAAREVKPGDSLWVIHDMARNLAPYEDAQTLQEHVVTSLHPLLRVPMIAGSLSVEGLVLRDGPVYTSRAEAMRNSTAGARREIFEPTPQVAGPKTLKNLNPAEIRRLEKEVTQSLEARVGKRDAKKLVAKAGGNPERLVELVSA